MIAHRSIVASLALVASLAGCSSDKPKPAVLESITPQIAGHQVWQSRVDSVKFPLAVAARNNGFVLAGTDGTVLALAADDGRELWRAQVGAPQTLLIVVG